MLRTGNKGVPGPRRQLAGDRLLTPARRARPRWSTPTTSAGTVQPAGSTISRTASEGDSYACDAAFHPGGDGSDRLDDRAGGVQPGPGDRRQRRRLRRRRRGRADRLRPERHQPQGARGDRRGRRAPPGQQCVPRELEHVPLRWQRAQHHRHDGHDVPGPVPVQRRGRGDAQSALRQAHRAHLRGPSGHGDRAQRGHDLVRRHPDRLQVDRERLQGHGRLPGGVRDRVLRGLQQGREDRAG